MVPTASWGREHGLHGFVGTGTGFRMKRDAIFYVMPMGDIWLLRAIGSAAEAFPTQEDALAAAAKLEARGARVRVLSRSGREAMSPGLARATSTASDHAQAAAS